jgi:hypothetical protein
MVGESLAGMAVPLRHCPSKGLMRISLKSIDVLSAPIR